MKQILWNCTMQNRRIFLSVRMDDHARFTAFHACMQGKASLLWQNIFTGIPLVSRTLRMTSLTMPCVFS